MSGRRFTVIAVVAGILAALVSPIAPVAAATPLAPSGLTPDGTSAATNPVLSWDPVAGATSYRVELSRSPGFDALLWSATTVNHQATPTPSLPRDTLFWRVRAADSTGSSAWSTASFVLDRTAAPAQISPGDASSLPQPAEPPQLSWALVDGATSYELAYGRDPNLTSATTTTTRTTAVVSTAPWPEGTWYWQVRAVLGGGQATDWSPIWSYDVLALAQPELGSPLTSAVVADVELEWGNVPGASKYEVRVSNDENFNTIVAQQVTVATRWSPPTTLDNDQYWWQVRAYDGNNQTASWDSLDEPWQFERRWQFGDLGPERPALVRPGALAPAGSPEVTGDPFFYEWRPVQLASSYALQMGTDQNFSPGTFWECRTKQTTFTPTTGDQRGCMPSSGGTFYWRVRAVDGPRGVVTPWSDIWEVTYRPDMTPLRAPADAATDVTVPTMSWAHTTGAERYKLTWKYGSTTQSVTTYSTSYTPTTRIPAGSTVRWAVQAVYARGDTAGYPLLGERTFTVGTPPVGTAGTPDALSADTAGDRFPALRWKAVEGAANYRVFVGNAGSFTQMGSTYAYPAATDATSNYLQSRGYDWFVQAYAANGTTLGNRGAQGRFTIADLAEVSGQAVAATGTQLDGPLRCTRRLDQVPDTCSVPQTPVLDWDPVEGASGYYVSLARDRNLTNMVTAPVPTHRTRWTPTEHLPDSQAGQAYYWVIRPCKKISPVTVCSPDPTQATNSFDKTSASVEQVSPVVDETVGDTVTMRWRDYLQTNQDSALLPGQRSTVEAMQYRVQVSTSETFQSVLDTATVDQTTWTSSSRLYPEGPIWWRVSAIDGSGNVLASGAPRELLKASDPVQLRTPADGSVGTGGLTLGWRPRSFAGSYQVEVYKNADRLHSPANRVVSATTRLSAYALRDPLPSAPLDYVWRVRAVDVSGNPGPWSDDRAFRVRGVAPRPLAPVSAAVVDGTGALFTWQGVGGAATYRFERRLAGAPTNSETVTTVGLAWAPTARLADGAWEWRVSSVDAAGAVAGTTAWRPFTVDGTAPNVLSHSPQTQAARTTNVRVTFSERVRHVDTASVRLFRVGRQHPLLSTVTPSTDRLSAVLDPARDLVAGATYRAVVTSAVTDVAGNPLPRLEWEFTVRR